jgi:hypothetical protein
MKTQTAVEFYREELNALISFRETKFKTEQEIFEQAKAMHKEEMDKVAGDFWNEGASYMHDGQRKYKSFDDYYNEIFGGEL